MPRKRKDLAPPEKFGEESAILKVHPKVQEIYEKYGDPLEELAKMAKELELDHFTEDAISTRARILSDLASYGYAKFKSRDSDTAGAQAQKVEINILGVELPKVVSGE